MVVKSWLKVPTLSDTASAYPLRCRGAVKAAGRTRRAVRAIRREDMMVCVVNGNWPGLISDSPRRGSFRLGCRYTKEGWRCSHMTLNQSLIKLKSNFRMKRQEPCIENILLFETAFGFFSPKRTVLSDVSHMIRFHVEHVQSASSVDLGHDSHNLLPLSRSLCSHDYSTPFPFAHQI